MLPYQPKIVSIMAISFTQMGNVQHSIVTNVKQSTKLELEKQFLP